MKINGYLYLVTTVYSLHLRVQLIRYMKTYGPLKVIQIAIFI